MRAWTRARLERVALWSPAKARAARGSMRPGHRPKERPFSLVSPTAVLFNLSNLPHTLAEVNCLARTSTCRSAVGLVIFNVSSSSLFSLCTLGISIFIQDDLVQDVAYFWQTSLVFACVGAYATLTNTLQLCRYRLPGHHQRIELNSETDDEDMEDEETRFDDRSASVRNIRAPGQPTQSERGEHINRHRPCRSWCKFCVGRGVNSPHRRSDAQDDLEGRQSFTSSTPALINETVLHRSVYHQNSRNAESKSLSDANSVHDTSFLKSTKCDPQDSDVPRVRLSRQLRYRWMLQGTGICQKERRQVSRLQGGQECRRRLVHDQTGLSRSATRRDRSIYSQCSLVAIWLPRTL